MRHSHEQACWRWDAQHAAVLTSSVVACSETASCAVQWRAKCSRSGTRPTVDTVTCTVTQNGAARPVQAQE